MERSRFRTGLVSALVALVLALLPAVAPTAPAAEPPGLQKAMQVQDRNTPWLMALPNVVGTATGVDAAGNPALKVFLAKGGVRGIPAKVEGVPVVVEVTGEFSAFSTTDRWQSPVPIGVSTGNEYHCSAGTIGCRVTDGQHVFALSNVHVFDPWHYGASPGAVELGEHIVQPGRIDDPADDCYGKATPENVIGKVVDSVPIEFRGRASNKVDAAIAIVPTEDYWGAGECRTLGNSTPGDGYGTPKSTIVSAFIGQEVQKYGRTTKLTVGVVDSLNATVRITYSSGTAWFDDQIIVTPGAFSDAGDSGSLVVVKDVGGPDDLCPVGLLFAGSSLNTVCNRIDLVLEAFGVIVDGEGAPPPNNPPVVTITSPTDGSTFESGVSISFVGEASDPEDADRTASLVWTSDTDGQIGTGGSFYGTLSDGTHTVTASVTDSGGLTGSDSISITVGEPAPEVRVLSVFPDSGPPGQTLDLYITGTGFQDGATADFGDRMTVQLLTFEDPENLVARVKIHPRAASGSRDVTVTNPDGSSGTLEGGFTVQ